MVSNPSVNYMLYEYLRARLEDWRRVLAVGEVKFQKTSPAGASCLRCFMRAQIQLCLSLEGTPALWKMQLQGAFEFWDAIIGVTTGLATHSCRMPHNQQPVLTSAACPIAV